MLASQGLNNHYIDLPFPKQQILDSSKLKVLVDENFKIEESGREFSKRVENIVVKGEIVFSKNLYCRQVKTKACLRKG